MGNQLDCSISFSDPTKLDSTQILKTLTGEQEIEQIKSKIYPGIECKFVQHAQFPPSIRVWESGGKPLTKARFVTIVLINNDDRLIHGLTVNKRVIEKDSEFDDGGGVQVISYRPFSNVRSVEKRLFSLYTLEQKDGEIDFLQVPVRSSENIWKRDLVEVKVEHGSGDELTLAMYTSEFFSKPGNTNLIPSKSIVFEVIEDIVSDLKTETRNESDQTVQELLKRISDLTTALATKDVLLSAKDRLMEQKLQLQNAEINKLRKELALANELNLSLTAKKNLEPRDKSISKENVSWATKSMEHFDTIGSDAGELAKELLSRPVFAGLQNIVARCQMQGLGTVLFRRSLTTDGVQWFILDKQYDKQMLANFITGYSAASGDISTNLWLNMEKPNLPAPTKLY